MGAEANDRRQYATREAPEDKQEASFKKTSIEIPVMLLKHSLVTKTTTDNTFVHSHSRRHTVISDPEGRSLNVNKLSLATWKL